MKGIDIPITASIGVATFPDDGANLVALFSVADARLYEAKDAGRNRVVGWKGPAADGESVVGFDTDDVPYSRVERDRSAKPRA